MTTSIGPHADHSRTGKHKEMVRVTPDIAKKIDILAERRQIHAEELVNEILDRYLSEELGTQESCVEFLHSIAGMFDSGTKDTSENVNAIVTDFIIQRNQ
jgi:hypothetical protein